MRIPGTWLMESCMVLWTGQLTATKTFNVIVIPIDSIASREGPEPMVDKLMGFALDRAAYKLESNRQQNIADDQGDLVWNSTMMHYVLLYSLSS